MTVRQFRFSDYDLDEGAAQNAAYWFASEVGGKLYAVCGGWDVEYRESA